MRLSRKATYKSYIHPQIYMYIHQYISRQLYISSWESVSGQQQVFFTRCL